MKNIIVEVKVKEWVGGHYTKSDSFKGTPEVVTNTLLQKYVGANGYERLGRLILTEIKQNG